MPAAATLLAIDRSISSELCSGQSHTYAVALQVDDYALVIVDQRGIDVAVRLEQPDRTPIVEFDSDVTTHGSERVEWVAATEGQYSVVVVGKGLKEAAGGYDIRLASVRAATAIDRTVLDAHILSADGIALARAGKYADAQNKLERALELREKAFGPDHSDVASCLNTLGAIVRLQGEYKKAEQLYLRALEIKQKVLGAEHRDVGAVLNNLAILYNRWAQYDRAEETNLRVLAIKEKALGPDHVEVGWVWNNLAHVSYNRGDLEKAEQLFRRALEIRERAVGADHPEVAQTLNNLGSVCAARRDLETAAQLYRRALAIREHMLGPEHPELVSTLNNIAEVCEIRGDFDAAETLLQRALIIREKALGPDHPDTATSMFFVANSRRAKGALQDADAHYHRALDIRVRTFGENHPAVGEVLEELAILYWVKGDLAAAVDTQARAARIVDHNLLLNLTAGSERQKLAYLAALSAVADRTISLHATWAPESPPARQLAAAAILRRKGRVLDVMSDSLAAIRQRSSDDDRALLDQLSDVVSRLAALVLAGRRDASPADHQHRVDDLEEQREHLERQIGRRSAEFQLRMQSAGLMEVESAIPERAALLEFATYRRFDPRLAGSDAAYQERRYVVYILRRDHDIGWRDLGDAASIDNLVREFREALRDPARQDALSLARAMDARILQPLRPLLGDDTTRLLVSPDGDLNLIPFEALLDEESRYLIERFEVTYLTSGRDLLRLRVARESRSAPLIVANPRFGDSSGEHTPGVQSAATVGAGARRSITTARSLNGVYFAPLGGAALEAESIHAMFPAATMLTGADATKVALKGANAPGLLHIATHGFFLEDAEGNPLLRSGLAFAGANMCDGGNTEGILTALEASGLNLWGTRLVTLSACDTGLGAIRNGEGVYGLRRALVLAGAETLVMSLWSVNDYVTREIMIEYYKSLQRGLGRGEALRHVKRALLTRDDRRHPFYWASFIQSGAWTSLDVEWPAPAVHH
jgi:CHAT domain-containing protein/Tfp pilus assembly protein PilF